MKRKQFEYKSEFIGSTVLIKKLNEFGKDGWELVSVEKYTGLPSSSSWDVNFTCIFKREIL